MANKKKGLGRSLDQLLTTKPAALKQPKAANDTGETDGQLRFLATRMLKPGKYQPRKEMDLEALEELANSIRAQGMLQPIVVRPIDSEHYEIIAGERRWRAAQMAGLSEVPTLIKDVSDEVTVALALIENIQRENLNPIEEANALQRLIDEFAMTHQQVAESVGKSRTTVSNLLRLTSLHPDAKVLLERGDIELGHAKVLLSIHGTQQVQAARMVAEKGLSVRETEALIQRMQTPHKPAVDKPALAPELQDWQSLLTDKLGTNVKISQNAKGKGKLEIHYKDQLELEGILEKL
ncbi:MAG: chromosome partitioning protein ParB [Legionellales bacterium]|nr:chromosome partitioning protein ParB [Legionellales bacterium]|tara:strand:+ start:72136 stop:73014 length:879 start_codon:yes stop_codon:yes gene_type:complete